MALLEQWQKVAYNEKADRGELQRFWQRYFLLEKGVYEQLLTNPDEKVEGTVKELAEKYNLSVMEMTGFLDGINDSLVEANPIDTMEEDTKVNLVFDKEKFMNNPMKFWCVATDAATGEPVYHQLHDAGYADLEWIRASSSIPFFAHPVAIRGHYYFDGGVSDSIPYDFLNQKNCNKKVVITTQPKSYRKKQSKLYPLEKVILRQYPAVLKKLSTRAKDYNAVLDQMEKDEKAGKAFIIRPPFPLEIGTLETDKKEIQRVYEVGQVEAEKVLPALREYLNK